MSSRVGVGSFRQYWSALDAPDNEDSDSSLAHAAEQAIAHGQIVVWDQSARDYAIALYDLAAQRLLPLTDAQVGILLNRDGLIAREWKKWNAMTGNTGSLIVLDIERAQRVLDRDKSPDDDGAEPSI